jgi:glutamate synthase domain-containing protein 3
MTRSDADDRTTPVVPIPEIRDYQRINAELARLLDEGHARVRLAGAEGQRLLVSELAGSWQAVVEVEGRAGPELAAGLDAPALTVVCRGPAADGAARGLRAGRLMILGDVGVAVGYAQEGGLILVTGSAGARAGLNQRGGMLVVLGAVGRLAGDRQSGGLLFAFGDRIGPHAGRGARAGRFVRLTPGDDPTAGLDPDDASIYRSLLGELKQIGEGGESTS